MPIHSVNPTNIMQSPAKNENRKRRGEEEYHQAVHGQNKEERREPSPDFCPQAASSIKPATQASSLLTSSQRHRQQPIAAELHARVHAALPSRQSSSPRRQISKAQP
jgi:hypothetical protein